MVAVVMIAGALVELAAWWAVSRRGISIWVVMGIALPALGVAAIAVGEPSVSPSVNGGAAAAAGAAAGLVLYLATRVFVAAVRPWRSFQRHSVELYARQAGLPLVAAIVLAAGVMVPGEELFWRGLFQAKLSVVLDGRTTTVALPRDEAVLDSAMKVRGDLPFACKGGVCGTCRARVTDGEVVMRRNYALEAKEVEAGYVLTCQTLPITDTVTVDFDA